MKNPLKRYVIAVTGDFGEPRNHRSLERWIVGNGGIFSATVTKDVTHLICTWDDWKEKVLKGPGSGDWDDMFPVRQALRLDSIKIVNYDWLEDSLLGKRPRREKPYLLQTVEKEKRREDKLEKRAKREAAQRFKDSCLSAEEETLSRQYHIYRDVTMFEYSVILSRVDMRTNRNERHHLKLYESNALPHLYTVGTRFTRMGGSGKDMLCPLSSFFDQAFARFRAFFKQKTGLDWEDRLSKKKRTALETDSSLFRYLPPVLGRPRGVMRLGTEADDDDE